MIFSVVVLVRGSWALFGVGLVLDFRFFPHSVLVLGEERAPKKWRERYSLQL